ncbi:hypothetical protein Tco_0837928 [Tanacetum coccineum]
MWDKRNYFSFDMLRIRTPSLLTVCGYGPVSLQNALGTVRPMKRLDGPVDYRMVCEGRNLNRWTLRGNGGESFWEGGDDFEVDVLRFHTCRTDILGFLEKFRLVVVSRH